jgi:hypothetical protein
VKSKSKPTLQSPLPETLEGLHVDQIRPRAKLCAKNLPTRKSDLIAVVVSAIHSVERLKQLWSQLDDLSRKAIAAALEQGGTFDRDAFRAQYGSLPWDALSKKSPMQSYSYQREYLPIDVLMYNDRIPPDVVRLLKPLAPAPEKHTLKATDQLPAAEADDLLIAETEEAALHDLTATLGLIAEGKAALTSANLRPTSAAVVKLSERLLHGEFLPGDKGAPSDEPIRAYGWLILAQAAKLAKPAGSKLELTPKGQKTLSQPGIDQLRDVFQNWLGFNGADELTRIGALKGLRGKGARLTHPTERKQSIVKALSQCPIGQWIEIEDFLRAIRAWRLNFEVEQPSYYGVSKLYVGSMWEYGYLGGFGHEEEWRATQAQYVLVCLWEYLATLGALDVAYFYPEAVDFELGNLGSVSDERYFSRYIGLRYFRINALGAYLLGLAKEYAGPARSEDRPVFTVMPNYEVAITQREEFAPNVRMLLERIAEPVSEGIYRLQRDRILTALETGLTLEAITEFLIGKSAQPLPKAVLILLGDIQRNSRALKESGSAVLFSVADTALALLLANDNALRGFCSVTNNTTLVVPAEKEATFRRRVKQLGYGIRR